MVDISIGKASGHRSEMRYFLRKYKEKINQFKPVQLCFDSDNDSDATSNTTSTSNKTTSLNLNFNTNVSTHGEYCDEMHLASIPEMHQVSHTQSHTQSSCQMTTRSKMKQMTAVSVNVSQRSSYSASPTVTLTTQSKKTLSSLNANGSPMPPISTNTAASKSSAKMSAFKSVQMSSGGRTRIPLAKNSNAQKIATNLKALLDTDSSHSDDEMKMCVDETLKLSTGSTSSSTSTSSSSSSSSSSCVLKSHMNNSSDSENEDMSCEKTNGKSGGVTSNGTTPPHKKFRKLRLFDTPQTPKTLIKKSKFLFSAKIDEEVPASPKSANRKLAVSKVSATPKIIAEKSPCSCLSDENSDEASGVIRTIGSCSVHGTAKMPLRTRLFDHNGNHCASNSNMESIFRSPSPYHPQANINPFTPNNAHDKMIVSSAVSNSVPSTSCTNMSIGNASNLFSNNQHHIELSESASELAALRSSSTKRIRNQGSAAHGNGDEADNDEHGDDEVPKNKRLALRQCLVSRYHEEFHEVCKLGSGEFGDVFKCINRLDGCTYAIKRSKKPIAGSALEIAAWKEVCAHAVLVKHNHIVQYYSAWAEADRMLIQNEYCNGGSLAEFMETNRLNGNVMNESELKILLLHTARGLAYMHSLHLVHLDIKPGNIFMCRNPRNPTAMIINEESGIESEIEQEENLPEVITYKIGDLGHVTSTLDPRVEEGDCRYLPNEILQEEYNHLTKADIFALALTVYVCASNDELPKNGDEWHWIREGNLKELPHCSDRFQKLLLQMINKNPILRPSATTLVHHPCICPNASKNKAQLLKELNQEKFKNELLQRKVRQYEEQIKTDTPVKKMPSKFVRSLSLNLLP